MRGNLECLQNQIQISFQAGGVAYDNHCVRTAETDKIARNLFLGGMSHQGICTGQVYKDIPHIFVDMPALRASNRLSRPVSRVLIHAG